MDGIGFWSVWSIPPHPCSNLFSIEGSFTEAYENKADGRKIQFHLLLLLPKRNEVVSSQPLFHLVLAIPHLSCMAEKFPPSVKTPVLSKRAHSLEFRAVEEIKPRFHLSEIDACSYKEGFLWAC